MKTLIEFAEASGVTFTKGDRGTWTHTSKSFLNIGSLYFKTKQKAAEHWARHLLGKEAFKALEKLLNENTNGTD